MAAAPLIIGLESTSLTDIDLRRIETLQPAGFLLLERNLEAPGQIRSLTDSLRELDPGWHPIIAIEEESGSFSHLGRLIHPTPTPAHLGVRETPRSIAEHGAATGVLLSLLGINLNLAPVLDLAHDPSVDAEGRLWHTDTQRLIDHAGMWNRWLRKQDLRSAAKHFPAGGRASGSTVTLREMLAEDLIPFTALMTELDALVVGHQNLPALDPDRPASLSRRIVSSLLRDQLGFDRHLVLADDLSSPSFPSQFPLDHALPAALAAGNDLAIVARDPKDLEQAAERLSEVPAPQRQDTEIRIERFRKKLASPLPWSDDRWKATCPKLLKA